MPEPDVEAPIGASSKFKGVPTFNKQAAVREAQSYFDDKGQLDIEGLKHFEFLKQSNNIEVVNAQSSLLCTACDWSQKTFVDEQTASLIDKGEWDQLAVRDNRSDRTGGKTFKDTVSNLKWLTIGRFNKDADKKCPNCGDHTVICVDKMSNKESDDVPSEK